MKAKELIQLRLINQRLASTEFESCVDVVSHFGAMQSQDYAMAKWAIAIRMQKATDADIEMCVNSGDIIRTHVLRPTWHFVSRNDIRWMIDLSAPYVKKATQYIDRQVGLTDEVFKKAWKIIEVELQREDNLSKEELMDRLAKRKFDIENLLATQILIRAELEMRICSGVRKKNKATYTLFDSRVPRSEKTSKKNSLVKLASAYFNSRSPATVKDFMWWSGLNQVDAKFGISGLGDTLKRTSLDGLEYLYFENTLHSKKKISALLPAFDEYMVGYSEGRNIVFPPDTDKSLLGNGVFKPIALFDNTIAGTWKKTSKAPFVDIQFLDKDKNYNSVSSKLEAFKLFSEK